MSESDRPDSQQWPTEDDQPDISPDYAVENGEWPSADNDLVSSASPSANTAEPVAWPEEEPTVVVKAVSAEKPLPVNNEQARRDPPTIQFSGPLPVQPQEPPTVRVRIPSPPPLARPVEEELGSTQVIPQVSDAPDENKAVENAEDRAGVEPTNVSEPVATVAPTQPRPRRKGRKTLFVSIALLIIVGVAAGISFLGPAAYSPLRLLGLAGPTTSAPPAPDDPVFAVKPVTATSVAPTSQGVAAMLTGLATNPALGTVTGSVIDPVTGETLWQRDAEKPVTPASTGKLLATAAAVLTLDPQARLTTKVVAGPDPQTVVLVGGGDPTLSALPAGKESVYPGAAHLDDLVNQVKQRTNGTVRKIILDTSFYSGTGMASGWDSSDIGNGSVAPITPLMLDGGRIDPTGIDAPRTTNAEMAAAKEFAKRLGVDPSQVTIGTAAQGAEVLGSVSSAPLTDLITNLLQISDNVLAEAVARQVAIATGNEPSFAGASSAMLKVLKDNNFDLTGVTMVDGSGLSTMDRVPAKVLSSLVAVAAAPNSQEQRTAKLRPLLTSFPVAGGSGTLSDRYDTGTSAVGRGWVRAKTGTLDGVNTLAGVVLDSDNRILTFAFMSGGATNQDAARAALDTLAAALRKCGCQ